MGTNKTFSFVSSFSNVNQSPKPLQVFTKMPASRECYQITLVVCVVIFAFSTYLLVAHSIASTGQARLVGQLVGGGGMFVSGIAGRGVYKSYCRDYPTVNATTSPAAAHAGAARNNSLSHLAPLRQGPSPAQTHRPAEA